MIETIVTAVSTVISSIFAGAFANKKTKETELGFKDLEKILLREMRRDIQTNKYDSSLLVNQALQLLFKVLSDKEISFSLQINSKNKDLGTIIFDAFSPSIASDEISTSINTNANMIVDGKTKVPYESIVPATSIINATTGAVVPICGETIISDSHNIQPKQIQDVISKRYAAIEQRRKDLEKE